eukprot:m.186087 g.186087  ORF g.186087 m.186087 type:complete len:963 (-) comp16670_c0_seq1:209-3097(-)
MTSRDPSPLGGLVSPMSPTRPRSAGSGSPHARTGLASCLPRKWNKMVVGVCVASLFAVALVATMTSNMIHLTMKNSAASPITARQDMARSLNETMADTVMTTYAPTAPPLASGFKLTQKDYLEEWASKFHPIPKLIHQTWKTEDIPSRQRFDVATWTNMNPTYTYKLWTDHDMDEHMEANHADMMTAWDLMKPIEKADTFRYVVLYDFGGYYADIDVACTQPIDSWTDNTHNFHNIDFIVGFEVVTDRPDWADWFAARRQLCQWTMAAAPGHPALKRTLNSIRTFFEKKPEEYTIMMATGPGVWTSSISNHLQAAYNLTFANEDFFSVDRLMNNYIHIGTMLFMPLRSFAKNSGGYSPPHHFAQSDVLIRHGFSGSWKDSAGGKQHLGPGGAMNPENKPMVTCKGLSTHRGERVCAYGASPPQEIASMAFDHRNETKWLTPGMFVRGKDSPDPPWISVSSCMPSDWRTQPEHECPPNRADAPFTASGYAITSANDVPGRDPFKWVVEGLNGDVAVDANVSWEVLDRREGERFDDRLQRRVFTISEPRSFARYRLRVLGIARASEAMVQISELEFFNRPAVPDPPGVPTCANGVCVCCGYLSENEGVAKLTDGRLDTKMMLGITAPPLGSFLANITLNVSSAIVPTTLTGGRDNNTTKTARLPSGNTSDTSASTTNVMAVPLQPWQGYIVTTGNDEPGRDPTDWSVFGTTHPNATSGWVVLDTRDKMTLCRRNTMNMFRFPDAVVDTMTGLQWVRFAVRNTRSLTDAFCQKHYRCLQMSGFQLVGQGDVPNTAIVHGDTDNASFCDSVPTQTVSTTIPVTTPPATPPPVVTPRPATTRPATTRPATTTLPVAVKKQTSVQRARTLPSGRTSKNRAQAKVERSVNITSSRDAARNMTRATARQQATAGRTLTKGANATTNSTPLTTKEANNVKPETNVDGRMVNKLALHRARRRRVRSKKATAS